VTATAVPHRSLRRERQDTLLIARRVLLACFAVATFGSLLALGRFAPSWGHVAATVVLATAATVPLPRRWTPAARLLFPAACIALLAAAATEAAALATDASGGAVLVSALAWAAGQLGRAGSSRPPSRRTGGTCLVTVGCCGLLAASGEPVTGAVLLLVVLSLLWAARAPLLGIALTGICGATLLVAAVTVTGGEVQLSPARWVPGGIVGRGLGTMPAPLTPGTTGLTVVRYELGWITLLAAAVVAGAAILACLVAASLQPPGTDRLTLTGAGVTVLLLYAVPVAPELGLLPTTRAPDEFSAGLPLVVTLVLLYGIAAAAASSDQRKS
jgi:hypothetical protein